MIPLYMIVWAIYVDLYTRTYLYIGWPNDTFPAAPAQLNAAGKLASLNRSWQGNKGTFRALGVAGIEPMLSKSE